MKFLKYYHSYSTTQIYLFLPVYNGTPINLFNIFSSVYPSSISVAMGVKRNHKLLLARNQEL